jgi:pilus assembly protein Flp/PilA
MQMTLLNLYIKIQNLLRKEEGQDLIEYVLIIALIAFGATAGLKSVASSINNAFSSIANTLTTYTG